MVMERKAALIGAGGLLGGVVIAAVAAVFLLAERDTAPSEDDVTAEAGEPVVLPVADPVSGPKQLLTVPSGTELFVRVDTALSSAASMPGDVIEGVLARDVMLGDVVALAEGLAVRGRVEGARAAGRIAGPGQLAIVLEDVVLPDGREVRAPARWETRRLSPAEQEARGTTRSSTQIEERGPQVQNVEVVPGTVLVFRTTEAMEVWTG